MNTHTNVCKTSLPKIQWKWSVVKRVRPAWSFSIRNSIITRFVFVVSWFLRTWCWKIRRELRMKPRRSSFNPRLSGKFATARELNDREDHDDHHDLQRVGSWWIDSHNLSKYNFANEDDDYLGFVAKDLKWWKDVLSICYGRKKVAKAQTIEMI